MSQVQCTLHHKSTERHIKDGKMLKADQKNAGCISVGFIVIYQDCDTIKEKEAFFIMQLYYIDKHQIQEKLL